MQRNPNAISNSESIACLQELASYTVEVKCKSELHRFLIGRGGANIKAVSLAFPYLVAFAFFKFRRTRTNRQSIKPFFSAHFCFKHLATRVKHFRGFLLSWNC